MNKLPLQKIFFRLDLCFKCLYFFTQVYKVALDNIFFYAKLFFESGNVIKRSGGIAECVQVQNAL